MTALSANEIAQRLGRASSSVYAALDRLGVEPVVESGKGIKLYPEEAVELVNEAMRAPNAAAASRHQV